MIRRKAAFISHSPATWVCVKCQPSSRIYGAVNKSQIPAGNIDWLTHLADWLSGQISQVGYHNLGRWKCSASNCECNDRINKNLNVTHSYLNVCGLILPSLANPKYLSLGSGPLNITKYLQIYANIVENDRFSSPWQ